MNFMKRGTLLVSVILAVLMIRDAAAQVPTTTISDTVYYANGTPAQGTIIVSWSAFTTANGAAIAAGNTSVTLSAGGLLTVALAPNLGSTPMGNFYTAVYHLNDGETSREFWVVPVVIPGGGPAKLAGIRNQVLPTSVAMQAVTKQYVDAEILAAQIAPVPLSSSPYVLKAGDTMTGPLVLPGDPASALQAADKNYVDTSVAAVPVRVPVTGSTSVPTATPTTLFTFTTSLPLRVYSIVADIGQDPANFGVVGTMMVDNVSCKFVNVTASASNTLAQSGCSIQATQTSGSTQPVVWSYIQQQ